MNSTAEIARIEAEHAHIWSQVEILTQRLAKIGTGIYSYSARAPLEAELAVWRDRLAGANLKMQNRHS